MNQIRSIQALSQKELECGIFRPESSWHYEYRDQAYINFGGLNYELTEADVLTIFSQYGCPTDVILVRDKNTGESKGFGFLKYEDQRSTVLAVDNLNGARICGRVIRVDHAFYKQRDDMNEYEEAVRKELQKDFFITGSESAEEDTPLVKSEEKETGEVIANALFDDELADPMAAFIKK